MMQKSLVIIKPDGVSRGLVGEIVSRFERVGLKIIAMKMQYASKELAGKHYEADEEWFEAVGNKAIASYKKQGKDLGKTPREIGVDIRNKLMDFISMGPVVAMIIEGHNAIALIRKLLGATAPSDAEPGTIRGDYSFDSYQLSDECARPIQNLVHASDSDETAEREIGIWFDKDEIHAWARVDDVLLYRKV